MCLRLGLHVQIRLYYVLPYKAKVSAQPEIGFILYRCNVYLGLTMPNLQKKRLLIFEIFNIKKCTLFFFLEPSIFSAYQRTNLHHISVDCSTKRILEFHRWVTSFLVLDTTEFFIAQPFARTWPIYKRQNHRTGNQIMSTSNCVDCYNHKRNCMKQDITFSTNSK